MNRMTALGTMKCSGLRSFSRTGCAAAGGFRIALIALALSAGVPRAALDTAGLSSLDFRKVVRNAKDQVFPAVVFVRCIIESRESGERKSHEVAGSGVIIDPRGEVLTNWHVIDKASSVRCLLFDGRHFDAEIVGKDKDLDLSLLRLELPDSALKLPWARLGESSALREGDFVMAMGAPWGLSRSVSIGIVSCTKRFLDDNSEYSLWLQTDASICPGNSGGPLVNTDGEVVGINTLGSFFGGDMGFSVPSSTIREILARLREHGDVQWSWTGLRLQPLHDFDRNVYFEGSQGVIVTTTDEGSPARHAGIRDLDRIVRVNDTPVTALTDEDLPAIRRLLGLLPVDKPVRLRIERQGGGGLTVNVTPRVKGQVEGQELDCPRWDMSFKEINQFDNPELHFYRSRGVFVFGVKHPGNAAKSRLRERDIVVEVDGEQVHTLEDIKRIWRRSLDGIDQRARVSVKYLRGGLAQQAILDFSRDYERGQ